jgi:SAM-dependent methyltransferase
MKLKQESDRHLVFSEARELIYDQDFYPLVTHFTFAFQSSAIARMRFVKRVAAAMSFTKAAVADLGCGSGAMLCEVLRSKPGWSGYGLDISEASICYARRLAGHKGVAGRAAFQQGSITQLPFASSSIDLVIASEVIEHLPEPAVAFSEIARVLAPGGFLALTVPVDSHTPAHMNSPDSAQELDKSCQEAGLSVQSLSSKWHLTFGDDPRHLFAVAQLSTQGEAATQPVYSLLPPQISSAASNGIVSS